MSKKASTYSLKTLDLFSLPFQFTLGSQEKEKKTIFGGLLSVIIIFLSMAYFVYLCYLYFANIMQPTISTMNENTTTEFSMEYQQDMIAFRVVLGNGMNLTDYQASVGKVYLSYIGDFRYTDSAGNQKNKTFFASNCVDPALSGYQCFDVDPLKEEGENIFSLNYDPIKQLQDKLSLYVVACIPDLLLPGQVCATNPIEYAQVLLNVYGYLETRIKLAQFNTQSKKMEDRIKTEQYMFDQNLAFYSKYTFQKSDMKVIDGFIIQSAQESAALSDYVRVDSSISQSYLLQVLKAQVFGGFYFMLGPNNIKQSIQYVQFTSLFAQFSSVFNSLMFIGIFSKMFAQTEIMQDFISLQLQTYYKQTAVELLSEQDKKACNNTDTQNSPYKMLKSIQQTNYKKKIKEFLQISLFKRQSYYYFYPFPLFLSLFHSFSSLNIILQTHSKFFVWKQISLQICIQFI